MKKIKSLLAAALTAATALCSIPLMNVSVAKAASSDPKIYLDITVDEVGFRADVIFENVPEFRSSAIGFRLGRSWEGVGDGLFLDVTSGTDDLVVGVMKSKDSINYVAISGTARQDKNFNGVYASFYIKKTEYFDVLNSAINLYNGSEL